jgi:hypothetical protein
MKKFRIVTHLWPTADEMDKELLINLDNQSVTNRKTNHTYIPQISGQCKYPAINYSRNSKLIRVLLHNVLFYHKHRYLPEEIDHIDFNKLNNDINNLRPLTTEGNRRYNKKRKYLKGKKTSSKYIGVTLDKKAQKLKTGKVWRARVVVPKNHPQFNNIKRLELHLGFFKSEDEAGQVVNDKIRELGLEDISVMNDTPQERARKLSLFDNLEPITDLK